MLTVALVFIFAIYGVFRAKRLGGTKADYWMYGASFALAGFTLGMILSLFVDLLT